MNVKWLGHSVFLFEINGIKIIVDPFIKDNPKYELNIQDIGDIDYILLTHGHPDHIGDTLELFQSNLAQKVISSFEITQWLMKQGIQGDKIIDMNIGGMIKLNEDIKIHMVQAVHSNSIIDNGNIIYGGYPSGFIIETLNKTIYYSGDTGVFSDMKLIQDMYSPNIAMLPVGGRFTMSAKTASYACNNLLNVEILIPMHYDTFPLLDDDLDTLKNEIKETKIFIPKINEFFNL